MDLNNRVGGRADRHSVRLLLPLFAGRHRDLVVIAALAVLAASGTLGMYFFVGRALGALPPAAPGHALLPLYLAGVVLAGVGGAVAGHRQNARAAEVGAAVTAHLQARIFAGRLDDGLANVTARPAGRVVNTLLHDLPLVPAFLLSALGAAAGAAVTVLAVLVVVAAVDLRVLAVLLLLLGLVVPFRRLDRRLRDAAVRKISAMSGMQVFLEQRLQRAGVTFARNFGLERAVGADFDVRIGRLEHASADQLRASSASNAVTLAAHAGFLAVVVLLAWLTPLGAGLGSSGLLVLVLCTPLLIRVLQTESTLGYWISTAAAIVDTLGLAALTGPRRQSDPARHAPDDSASAAAHDSIAATASHHSDVATPRDSFAAPSGESVGAAPMQPVVAVRDLHYHYPATRLGPPSGEVLTGVDFEVRQGEFLAVVGQVGCGKSTLARLLAGLVEPTSGRVEVRIPAGGDVRRGVCLVDNHDCLFATTVAANLRMVDPGLSLRRMVQICDAVGVHEAIQRLPQGYETVIGESGMRLSSGQRQLLIIARAVAARPAAVVLDEATTCLDAAAEARAVAGLRREIAGPVILIAHRLSSVVAADRAVVLDGGRVAGSGRHDDLLEDSPVYRRFHELQNI